MSGKKASGQRRVILGVSLVAIVVVLVTLLGSGTALAADRWKDITDQQWINTYGVTAAQVDTVADGFTDGTFRPTQALNRGQAAKMVVDGFGIATKTPATPTFTDVIPSHQFYKWVEGGVDAQVITGYPDDTYRPNSTMQRQQANTILARYLSGLEKAALGGIQGEEELYETVTEWYQEEGSSLLDAFADGGTVATAHRPGTAYLVHHEVVQGSPSGGKYYLKPLTSLTRAQGAALILRVADISFATPAPTVTALNPSSGPTVGGNTVVITGTNFTGATAVRFGSISATNFVVNSAIKITAIAPAGPQGSTINVTVTTPSGTSLTAGAGDNYSYTDLPTIISLNPTGQPTTAAGTAVTITGTNFAALATVAFGGTAATDVVVVSATTITCKSPEHAVGVVDVTVTTPGGTSSTAGSANDYTYGLPTITSLSPTGQLTTAAGTTVTITGTGFVSGATVSFGGTAATSPVVVNATTITCVSPAHAAGIVDVTVTTAGGTSAIAGTENDYAYALPTVTALNPTGQPTTAAGTPVTITGANFVSGATVSFGGTPATSVAVVNATTITCVTPTHAAGVVEVTVTTAAGTSPTTGAGNDYTFAAVAKFAVTMSGGTTALSGAAKTAGTPFNVRVTAQDAGGATVTGYTGTVALTSNAFGGTVNAVIATGGFVDAVTITPTVAGSARTITAAQGTVTSTDASGAFIVNPGTLSKLQILLPGEVVAPGTATGKTGTPTARTAGVAFDVIVNAVDANWNLVNTTTHIVGITSNDANAGLPANAALVAGTKTFNVTLKTAGSRTVTASNITSPGITPNTSPAVTVNPGTVNKLQALLPGEMAAPGTASGKTGTPSNQPANTPFNVTVNAVDANWNLVDTTTHTVALTTTDPDDTHPANASLVAGSRTFSVSLGAGTWTATASDVTQPSVTAGTSASVTVAVGTFTKLQILLPGETAAPGTPSGKTGSPTAQTAGVSFNVTVNACDANWNVVNSGDTVHLASSDPNAVLAADTALVGGTKTLAVMLKTAGNRTITVSDVTNPPMTPSMSAAVSVGAGTLSKLQILLPGETAAPGTDSGKTGSPVNQAAGVAFDVTVNAVDTYWNKVSTTHTTKLQANPGGATLAQDALVAGTRSFSVTLSAGAWTITASNVTDAGVGSDTSTSVTAVGGFVKLRILLPGETADPSGKTGTPNEQVAGVPFNVTVQACDANWNVVDSSDVVGLTSSDPSTATLPANAALVDGTKVFSVTLRKAGGPYTITATDITDPLGRDPDSSNLTTVNTGVFAKLQILLPGEVAAAGTATGKTGTPSARTAGAAFNVTVNAVDANWNLVDTVTHVVGITSSDGGATLPGNAALGGGTKADFSVTLTAGSWTVTASDVTDGTKTANTSPSVAVN